MNNFLKINFNFVMLLCLIDFELMNESERYQQYFDRDINLCSTCFHRSEKQCKTFFETIEYDPGTTAQRFMDMFPKLGRHDIRLLHIKNTENMVVAKSLSSCRHFETINKNPLTRSTLSKIFFDSVRMDDLQYCPPPATQRFVDLMEQYNDSDELTTWIYMLVNVQPILMPYLYSQGFPVPKTLTTCGFTTFQEYAGKPMSHYYKAHFGIKLRIAKQLLEGVLKFSNGFNRFRLYITDLTPDNVVYDEERDKLYFVDLDSLLIVDADSVRKRTELGSIHKHEYIECEDCFAYVQEDICEHENSDFVLFQACQILREDLNRVEGGGFFHPIPPEIFNKYLEFDFLLDMCVDCVGSKKCQHRFAPLQDLIHLYENIIYEMKY